MLIGGLQKLSLLDYPGKLAAVIFTIGCNFRCGFCHNPHLVNSQFPISPDARSGSRLLYSQINTVRRDNSQIDENEIFDFLKSRQGLLDGVVITGGEPTIQPDLIDFIKKIKEMGFLVKLDTNGSNPIIIGQLVEDNLVNFLAMDIKAPLEKYQDIVKCAVDTGSVKKSIEAVKSFGGDYEFRSTVVSGLHSSADILNMARLIRGARKFVLQQFVSRDKLVDPSFVGRQSFSKTELEDLARQCEQWVEKCEIR